MKGNEWIKMRENIGGKYCQGEGYHLEKEGGNPRVVRRHYVVGEPRAESELKKCGVIWVK